MPIHTSGPAVLVMLVGIHNEHPRVHTCMSKSSNWEQLGTTRQRRLSRDLVSGNPPQGNGNRTTITTILLLLLLPTAYGSRSERRSLARIFRFTDSKGDIRLRGIGSVLQPRLCDGHPRSEALPYPPLRAASDNSRPNPIMPPCHGFAGSPSNKHPFVGQRSSGALRKQLLTIR